LQDIFEKLQQITQWLPGSIDHALDNMYSAKALIEMLEADDCGSHGGFDPKNPLISDSGFDLYDRFTTVLRKYDNEKDIKKSCNFDVQTLKGYFENISTLRDRSYRTEHPAERLKNHLSPLFNLVTMLHKENLELPDRKLNKIFQDEVQRCFENLDKIKKYLDQVHKLR